MISLLLYIEMMIDYCIFRHHHHHTGLGYEDRDRYANRRGLGGIDVPGPSHHGTDREHRSMRSRSPERKHGEPAEETRLPTYAESEEERRRAYLKKREKRREKKVQF